MEKIKTYRIERCLSELESWLDRIGRLYSSSIEGRDKERKIESMLSDARKELSEIKNINVVTHNNKNIPTEYVHESCYCSTSPMPPCGFCAP